MKRGPLYTIAFAAAVGLACAALLTASREWTAERRAANERAERYRQVLGVLGVKLSPGADNETVLETFDARVRRETRGGLALYATDAAVAVPFTGTGLWGPISGFLALSPDLSTIRRVTFFQHSETPGLGGRIDESKFKQQFEGARVLLPDGTPGVDVQAIDGATMTSERVDAMLDRILARVHAQAEATDDR